MYIHYTVFSVKSASPENDRLTLSSFFDMEGRNAPGADTPAWDAEEMAQVAGFG